MRRAILLAGLTIGLGVGAATGAVPRENTLLDIRLESDGGKLPAGWGSEARDWVLVVPAAKKGGMPVLSFRLPGNRGDASAHVDSVRFPVTWPAGVLLRYEWRSAGLYDTRPQQRKDQAYAKIAVYYFGRAKHLGTQSVYFLQDQGVGWHPGELVLAIPAGSDQVALKIVCARVGSPAANDAEFDLRRIRILPAGSPPAPGSAD